MMPAPDGGDDLVGIFLAKGFSGLDPEAAATEDLADSIRALTESVREAIPGRR